MAKCIANASSVEVCSFGDQRILEETEKVFKKEKNMKKGKNFTKAFLFFNEVFYFYFFKGSAFPTCISCNNCICHFSPLKSDPDYIIKEGDLVKM